MTSAIHVELPDWLMALEREARSQDMRSDAARMRLAISASRGNVQHRSGGPFGAAVFRGGELIALGANLVLAGHASSLHAEVVALTLAQQRLGRTRLDDVEYELVSSAEPCAMCLGAVQWSGVSRLVYAALDSDVRAIGFDEGIKPADWPSAFAARGIRVEQSALREEACRALADYSAADGTLY